MSTVGQGHLLELTVGINTAGDPGLITSMAFFNHHIYNAFEVVKFYLFF
jgi:hypothetical protein